MRGKTGSAKEGNFYTVGITLSELLYEKLYRNFSELSTDE
jgi:hypothetical protein